jgi:hypothetical protein
MPGPVSDSYDPEWGTGYNGSLIKEALGRLYGRVSEILGNKPPIYILDLVDEDELECPSLPTPIAATLTEWEWRVLRFALERAKDSI